jgi:hypothetical protein
MAFFKDGQLHMASLEAMWNWPQLQLLR